MFSEYPAFVGGAHLLICPSFGLSRKSGILSASFFAVITTADRGRPLRGCQQSQMQSQASLMPIDFLLSTSFVLDI